MSRVVDVTSAQFGTSPGETTVQLSPKRRIQAARCVWHSKETIIFTALEVK